MPFRSTEEGIKIRIGADLTPFQKAIARIEHAFGPMHQSLTRAGSSLTKRVSLPLAAVGAASAKAAIDFESAFAGVRKTIDASESEFAALRKGILKMSKELPSSANEIAGVAEAAGQLGIETKNVLAFTRTMIDLGETTNLSSNEAATALARFANVMQMSQSEFDRLGSAIVGLGNNFATTEREIVEMSLRLAGTGKQIGLSEADVLAFATALSSVGIEAEAGGTAFSKLFAQIQGAVSRGGPRLQQFARVAGMTGDEFTRAFEQDAARAITAFVQGLGNISRSGGDTLAVLDQLEISEIRMRSAILNSANAGNLLSDALERSNTEWRNNNALTKEAAQRYETTAARLEVAKNRITAAAIEAGEHLLPALEKAASAAGDLADAFSDLNPSTQKVVISIGGLVAAAGPLLWVLGKIAGATKTISAGFRVLTGPIGIVTGILGSFVAHVKDLGNIEGLDLGGILRGVGPAPLTRDVIEQMRHMDNLREAAEHAAGSISRLQVQGALVDAGLAPGTGMLATQSLLNSLTSQAESARGAVQDLNTNLEGAGTAIEKLNRVPVLPHDTPGLITMANERFAEMQMRLRGVREVAALAAPELAKMTQTVVGIGSRAVDNLSFAIGEAAAGFESFGDAVKRVMRSVVADIGRAIAKALILKSLVAIGGAIPTSSLGGFGGFLGSALMSFGGGRAMGGPVSAGTGYLVGERGPELFVPRQSGTIVPNTGVVVQLQGRAAISMGELVFAIDEYRRANP